MTRIRWKSLLRFTSGAVLGFAVSGGLGLAAPHGLMLIAPNSSYLLAVPKSGDSGLAAERGWIEGGLPGSDAFRAYAADKDLEYRVGRALRESEERGLTGQASLASRQADYDQMKKLAQKALSIAEKSQIEWQRRRVSQSLKKSIPSESARQVEDSVAVVGGVAAAGLGAPLRLKLLESLELESSTHLIARTGEWKVFSPIGRSQIQVRLLEQGSQLQASHSYPILIDGLTASISALRLLDGASIPGVTDDERVQLDYTVRF